MSKPGPRTTCRYSPEFKATAVRLSQLPGVAVRDVAESLYIHPFMLSRWRRLAREGQIMSKGVDVDPAVAARPLMKFLGTLGILLTVAGCASIDAGPAPKIDGTLGDEEWISAETHAIPGGGTIRLRRMGNDLYIAVSALESGFPTIFVGNTDAIDVLHASAAQASVKYLRSRGTWTPTTPRFEYTLRQTSDGQQAPKAARDEFFKTNKWLSISDRANGSDREFLVRLDSERRFLAISFLGVPSMNIHGWPAHVSDSTKSLQLLQGEVPLELDFAPESWHPVGQ